MNPLKAFLAGAIAVPVFHQGMLVILNAVGMTDRGAFSMEPTPPFGVPQLVSSMFWGGLWGIILWLVVRRIASPAKWWTVAIVFGALATTLVAGLVAAPLKGQPIAGGGDPSIVAMGLLVNGAWAAGTAILLRLFRTGTTTLPHAEPGR